MAIVRSDPDATLSGAAGRLALAAGWALTERAVLYGEISDAVMSDPTLEVQNVKVDTKGNVRLVGLTAGIVFYIPPSNVYLSAALGAGQVTADDVTGTGSSRWGPGVHLAVGKEWWLGRGLALGGALLLDIFSLKTSDRLKATLTEGWIGLAVNLTYN
jgi:hypothetical protein